MEQLELTSECKKSFAIYLRRWNLKHDNPLRLHAVEIPIDAFKKLPFETKYGLIIGFFDNVDCLGSGIKICIDHDGGWCSTITTPLSPTILYDGEYDTREEAFIRAANKSNKLYNNQLETTK